MQAQKFIVNADQSIRVQIAESTRATLAALIAAGAEVGLSSIKELIAGRRQEVKGFTVIEVQPEPEPAVVPRGRSGGRPKMVRSFTLTPAVETATLYRGRFRDMINLIGQGTNTVEALTEALNVSRLWVLQEICRARKNGLINQI